MRPEPKKDLVASIRARLLNLAKDRGEDLDLILKRYGIERLLYRLSHSVHQDLFVLKGAMLFELWMGRGHRTTRDLDLLGYGMAEIERMESIFRELCLMEVEHDGLRFLADSVRGNEIREGNLYQGIRILLQARLGVARITLQVDIGFGDAVFPAPEFVEYPSLLGLSSSRLRAYPKESVIAEKLHAMVVLGMVNTRLKDYLDIWILLQEPLEQQRLRSAIQSTFDRRQTPLPANLPAALSTTFSTDLSKVTQWKAFLKKTGAQQGLSLTTVVEDLAIGLGPIFEALR